VAVVRGGADAAAKVGGQDDGDRKCLFVDNVFVC
jgi:hypothetical protein